MYRKSDQKRMAAFLNYYPELQDQLRECQLKVSGCLDDIGSVSILYDVFYEEEDIQYVDDFLRDMCKPEFIEPRVI